MLTFGSSICLRLGMCSRFVGVVSALKEVKGWSLGLSDGNWISKACNGSRVA